jgi:hypothetical protein
MMKRMMRKMTTSMIMGANTHHQEILMTPKSLRKRRIRKITPNRPIPELELLAIVILLYKLISFHQRVPCTHPDG